MKYKWQIVAGAIGTILGYASGSVFFGRRINKVREEFKEENEKTKEEIVKTMETVAERMAKNIAQEISKNVTKEMMAKLEAVS